jgi:hypothetical protein
MPAIEAIGSALETGVKIAGNNFLNSLINAGKFLSSFFSSDLPGIILDVLVSVYMRVISGAAKAFIDAFRSAIEAFETWLGAAISNVIDFFSTKFSKLLNAVAKEFQAAMSDPIGYVSGKFGSLLEGVMDAGSREFQTSFDKAGGSVLDKLSAGLGAVSDQYNDKIVAGATRAKDEFGKLVDSIEPSARDFFGAEESAARTKDKFGEVVEAGKKLREEFEKSATSADAANKSTSGAVTDAEAIAGSFDKVAGSAAKAKEELTESAKLFKSIEEARAKDATDPGGRNAQRVQDAIGRGDFAGAERAAGRIAAREENQANRAAAKQAAAEESSKSIRERLADTSSSLRDRFNKTGKVGEGGALAGAPTVDKPGQSGQTDKDARGKDKTDGKSSLDSMVESIHKLLEKIEPRLPVAALTA